MKRYLIGATVVAGCAGAVGVGAGTTVNLRGSDTLFDFTNALMASCPGTAGPYAGTGSGNGQSAMVAGSQQIAPMSRFLNNGACTGGVTIPRQSEGLVIGLDGIAVVGSTNTFTNVSCNGDSNPTCDPTFEPNSGAAYDTVVSGYTFNGWRDVLRVLLAGFDHNNTGTNAAAWAARDCNSAIRQTIANNYGNFFENHCVAPAGETSTTVCTQIRHIFRRDDFSGTTDTMISLLGLPAIVLPETPVTLNTNGTATTITNHTGATPFCNAVRPSFVFPQSSTTVQPTCPVGADSTWDPTVNVNIAGNICTDPVSGRTKERAVYRATMQDNDPIRRACSAKEQVCSHGAAACRGLGLIMTMNDVPEPAPFSNADRYNATACASNNFQAGPVPDIYDNITQGKKISLTGALCPNGDTTPTGGCTVPATASKSPKCLAGVLTAPTLTVSLTAVPLICPAGPGVAEGRAYNKHLYSVGTTGSAIYQANGYTTPLPMTGAYYRIHTTQSLNPVTNRTCQFDDMTSQIGCLVEASPCSIGYAGRGSILASINPHTNAVKLNKQTPDAACIQSSLFLYPLSRKLYLNSITGFATAFGEELELAGCATDVAQPGLPIPTPGGLVTTSIVAAGFLPISPSVNSGLPFCEDFNEKAQCGATENNNACADPHVNIPNFPGFNTVCGNADIDALEDCDNGTDNGPPPATCSTSCRFNF
jgi:hypothetical protein